MVDWRTRGEDEDELFEWQIVANLHHLDYHQKAWTKLKIQQVLLDEEFPEPPSEPFNNFTDGPMTPYSHLLHKHNYVVHYYTMYSV